TGRGPDAISSGEAAVEERRDHVNLASLAYVYGVVGERARAERLLAELKAMESAVVCPYYSALAHLGIGHSGEALRLLAAACDVRDPAVVQIGVDPRLDAIRGEREFVRIAARLRLRDMEN